MNPAGATYHYGKFICRDDSFQIRITAPVWADFFWADVFWTDIFWADISFRHQILRVPI
jgi:hypothetical protein